MNDKVKEILWNGVGDLILSLSGTLGHVEVSQDNIKVEFGFGKQVAG